METLGLVTGWQVCVAGSQTWLASHAGKQTPRLITQTERDESQVAYEGQSASFVHAPRWDVLQATLESKRVIANVARIVRRPG